MRELIFRLRPRYNLPSFRDLLLGIAHAWANEPEEVHRVGDQLIQQLQQTSSIETPAGWPFAGKLKSNRSGNPG